MTGPRVIYTITADDDPMAFALIANHLCVANSAPSRVEGRVTDDGFLHLVAEFGPLPQEFAAHLLRRLTRLNCVCYVEMAEVGAGR